MSRRTTVPTVTVGRGRGWPRLTWRVTCGDPRCGTYLGSWWTWDAALRYANAHAAAHYREAVVRAGVRR